MKPHVSSSAFFLLLLSSTACAPVKVGLGDDTSAAGARDSAAQDSGGTTSADDSAGGDDSADDSAGGETGGGPVEGVAVPLTSLDGLAYTVDLTLGGQTFAAIIDTGSTTTAVAGEECSACRRVSPLYTAGESALDLGKSASSTYGDGSQWSGAIYEDAASLSTLPPVALDFAAIDDQSGFFQGNDFQGILGLGPDELLLRGTTSYMTELASAGLTEQMAFRLCPDGGDMWVGTVDPDAAASAVQYTPLKDNEGWNAYHSVDVDDLAVGGTSLGLSSDDFGLTILDTGTSLTYVPSSINNALLSAVNADPGFASLFSGQTLEASSSSWSCVSATGVDAEAVDAALPALSFSFPSADGGSFSVQIPASKSYLMDLGSWGSGDEQFCWAIFSSGSRSSYSLIGDSLLRGMLTVFDLENRQVGVAPVAGCEDSATHARRRPHTGTMPGSPEAMPGFRPPRVLVDR